MNPGVIFMRTQVAITTVKQNRRLSCFCFSVSAFISPMYSSDLCPHLLLKLSPVTKVAFMLRSCWVASSSDPAFRESILPGQNDLLTSGKRVHFFFQL
jgi:hypothetical protein